MVAIPTRTIHPKGAYVSMCWRNQGGCPHFFRFTHAFHAPVVLVALLVLSRFASRALSSPNILGPRGVAVGCAPSPSSVAGDATAAAVAVGVGAEASSSTYDAGNHPVRWPA